MTRNQTHIDNPVPNRIKKIIDARKELGLWPCSYNQLASEAGVTKNTIVNLARGSYFPMLDTAYRVARALNLTVYDIWNEAEVREFLNDLSNEQVKTLMREMEKDESETD